MPSYTTSGSGGDVLLANKMPEAEYMYGCVPTAMAMLLGYYDLYGYQGKDLSNIVSGTVTLKERGTDGNSYDMDAFDTVLGKLAASKEYVYRFYARDGKETTPEQELEYTFQEDNRTLKTDEWNCLADYLGTGQFWRGADNLVTMVAYSSLADLYSHNYSDERITDGVNTRMVRYNDTVMLPGLDLYVQSRGYQLDYEITGTYEVDVAGGSFTFNDYMKEIDSGRPVLIAIEDHVMLGYGYNQKTQEIIFDDCYKVDQRMKWGGTYHYSDADRKLLSITVIGFNLNGDVDLALVKTGGTQEKLTLTGTSGGAATDDYCIAGKGNTVYLNYTAANQGTKRSGNFQVSIYVDGMLYSSNKADSLGANKTRDVAFSLGKLSVGIHNVRVVLDEENDIQEANGGNNEAERSILVLKSGTEVVSENRQIGAGESAGGLFVYGGTLTLNGGSATDVTLRGKVTGSSYWGGRRQQGRADVSREGYLSGTVVYDNGELNVSSGGTAVNTTVRSAGRANVRSSGLASDLTVESGGRVTLYSGGELTGKIRIEDGASVQVSAGGVVNFDLSALAPGAAARVNVLSRIAGAPVYTLTVASTQAGGTYRLAGGAAKFSQTITVMDTEGVRLGELAVKKTLAVSHAAYKLNLDGESLVLTVKGNKPPTVSKIRADITKPTTKDVTVTAVFSDDIGLAESLYRIGEDGAWTAYGKKGVTVTGNATVYFKAVDIGGNESELGIYEVTNIDKSVLDDGGNNWLYSKKTDAEPNPDANFNLIPLHDGVSEVLLDADGSVSKEDWHNFVGYGDDADYAKIELSCASKLSFTAVAADKAKFVIYSLVEGVDKKGNVTYKLKTLQTTTLAKNKKTGEYEATTKALLLGLPDDRTAYYISMQSTNAKKDGYALYNVELNPDAAKTKFYADGDDGGNNWLYDKKNRTQNANMTESLPVEIASAGDEILFDAAAPSAEEAVSGGWCNFVGYGDDADFVKITLTAASELSFRIEAADKSKFTVYRLDEKTDRKGNVTYSMKSLTSKTLKKDKGADIYAAETKTVLLEAGVSYYLAIQSTNAAKGGCAYYNVSVNTCLEIAPAGHDASALTAPGISLELSSGANPAEPFATASAPAAFGQNDGLLQASSGLLA